MAKKKSTTKASVRSTAGKAKKKAASKSPKAPPGKRKRTGVVKKTKSVAAKAKPVASKAKKVTGKKKVASAKSAPSAKAVVKVKKVVATKSAAKNNNNNNTNKKARPIKRIAKIVEAPSDTDNHVKPKRVRKTRLSDEDLAMFRDMLLAKRAELVGDMTQLQNEALGRNRGDSSGDVSSMPTHMADLGSDNWEQEFTLGLIESERSLIREIDEALDRVKSRTYGICLATNKVIRKARLRAKPWAKYCIDHARKRELGQVR